MGQGQGPGKPFHFRLGFDTATCDLLILALGAGLLLLPQLGRRALWEPDEGRYSEIPREMLQSGDFVTPRLNGVEYFEKPPLFPWIEAASLRLFGQSEWALRLPVATFAFIGLAAVYATGRRLYGRLAALLSACALATSPLFFGLGQVVSLDMAVSVFLSVALLSFLLATRAPPVWQRRLLLWSFFLAAGGATLTKGLIGIVIPAMVIGAFVVSTRRWRLLASCLQPTGIALFLLVTVPWHLAVAQAHPEFTRFYFIHEHFDRYLTRVHRRYQPPWFFLPVMLVGMLPWSFFVPSAVSSAWKTRSEEDQGTLFLLLWAGVTFLFFSLSDSKLVTYILPVLPPVALILGRYLARAWRLGTAPDVRRAAVALLIFLGPLAVLSFWPVLPHGWRADEVADRLGGYRWALGVALALLAILPLVCLQLRRTRTGIVALVLTAAAFLAILGAAGPRLDSTFSTKPLVELLLKRLSKDDEVVVYRDYLQGLPFYLSRRVTVAAHTGELELGMKREPAVRAWMIDDPEFQRRWRAPRRVFAVVDSRRPNRVAGIRGGRLVARAGNYLLFANR